MGKGAKLRVHGSGRPAYQVRRAVANRVKVLRACAVASLVEFVKWQRVASDGLNETQAVVDKLSAALANAAASHPGQQGASVQEGN